MIPMYACLDGTCFAGFVWRPEMVTAFLAWWMPVNLVAYLAILALCSGFLGWSARPEATDLKRFFLSMFVTLPFLSALPLAWAYDELFGKARRKKEIQANREAFLKDHGITEDI